MTIDRHFIREGLIRSEIEGFLRNELSSAGYSGIDIQRTSLKTRITVFVDKPPLVIGRKGRQIEKLTRTLEDKFNLEDPSIDVQKVEQWNLDPSLVARSIVMALERGMNFRRVAHRAVKSVMRGGARGVEIILTGKIVGKGGKSRVEKFSEGYIKKAGDSLKLVRRGLMQAYLKAGVIGVTVKIVPPGVVFPDQIDVMEAKKVEKAVEKEKEQPEDKVKKRDKRAAAKEGDMDKKVEKLEKKVEKLEKKLGKESGVKEKKVEKPKPDAEEKPEKKRVEKAVKKSVEKSEEKPKAKKDADGRVKKKSEKPSKAKTQKAKRTKTDKTK
ncbi:MAG: 30S ribosomal protein S3 [Candidatus Altiarchaeales archaeon WOR_SM1_86-2]|nr:MAG: 30S ribosomal protein S3 [Candidatus Altiarchaeales archaeon WOR_SM1_86-2]